MVFSASLDITAWLITIMVLLIHVGLAVKLITALEGKAALGIRVFAYTIGILLPLAFLVFTFLYSPKEYEVKDDKIIIGRPIGDFVIDISQISKVSIMDRGISSTFKRTFASGGLFGYFGEVKDGNDDLYQVFATRRDRYVLIETTEGQKFVLSPDDENFVKLLEPLIHKI